MRQRFGSFRQRSMARPRGRDARLDLSPRARLIGGWLAAIVLVLLIAGAVRLFGGNADGTSVLPSGSAASSSPLPITFGTALDENRLVQDDLSTKQFIVDDLFAYSVADAAPASTVYVAVRRLAGGTQEQVQAAIEGQAIPDGPGTIGFTVPAVNLFDAFGPGTYEMHIALEPEGQPIAIGTFELIAPDASPSAADS
jgi:hypothetical protein